MRVVRLTVSSASSKRHGSVSTDGCTVYEQLARTEIRYSEIAAAEAATAVAACKPHDTGQLPVEDRQLTFKTHTQRSIHVDKSLLNLNLIRFQQ